MSSSESKDMADAPGTSSDATVANAEPSTSKDDKTNGGAEEKNAGKEEEESDVVTMCDVLEEEDALEADAVAVLGGADSNVCTYFTGG